MNAKANTSFLNDILCTFVEGWGYEKEDKYSTWGDVISDIEDTYTKSQYSCGMDFRIDAEDDDKSKRIYEGIKAFSVGSGTFAKDKITIQTTFMKDEDGRQTGDVFVRYYVYDAEDLKKDYMHAKEVMSCSEYDRYSQSKGRRRVLC